MVKAALGVLGLEILVIFGIWRTHRMGAPAA